VRNRVCDLSATLSHYTILPSQNAGQNCIGIERFLVHTSQHDELVSLFTDRAQRLRFGPSLADAGGDGVVATVDCGAMISKDRFAELERLLHDAAQEGAEVAYGGHGWRHPYVEEGMYFTPTVVGGVTSTMELSRTESKYIPVSASITLPKSSGSVRSHRLHYTLRICR
jgi:acyl-CoA reductase-like NAD-dependent aldehyde dehydrogenase